MTPRTRADEHARYDLARHGWHLFSSKTQLVTGGNQVKIGRVVGIIVTASLAGMLALGIAQAALATAHTSSAPRTAVSASDRTYCRALRTWDQAGIPSGSQTRTVARRALRANGKYRHTGTALVAAIVAGGSSSSEAHAALRACRGIR